VGLLTELALCEKYAVVREVIFTTIALVCAAYVSDGTAKRSAENCVESVAKVNL